MTNSITLARARFNCSCALLRISLRERPALSTTNTPSTFEAKTTASEVINGGPSITITSAAFFKILKTLSAAKELSISEGLLGVFPVGRKYNCPLRGKRGAH